MGISSDVVNLLLWLALCQIWYWSGIYCLVRSQLYVGSHAFATVVCFPWDPWDPWDHKIDSLYHVGMHAYTPLREQQCESHCTRRW